ncbi:hypothetical protein V1264_007349 [Littorina saxatilis]
MQLVQSPSTKHVQAITVEMRSFDDEVVQGLQQFLIFPLRTVLMQCTSQSLPEQVLIETCQALNVLLSKSLLHNKAVFMDLFSILTNLMFFDKTNSMAPRCLSEEEKMAVVQALCTLITKSSDEVLHEVYVPSNIARLGSVVSQLVAFVSDTKTSRSLRSQAMDTLLVLMQKRTYKHKEEWWQHGSRFAGLLPGISTAMLKVVIGDSKQGHQLFCKALDVWTEVACLTLGDESLSREQNEGFAWIDGLQMPQRLKELITRRDENWVKSVLPRMEFMIKEISKLKKHDNWKVRRAFVKWGDCLLCQCEKSLSNCASLILEVLVLLMTDSYTQVAAPAKAALEKYRDRQSSIEGCRPLVEILKENLYSLVTSLPRRIRMEDEEEKGAVVGLLNGYISLLGNNMSALLLSLPHVTRLAKVLVQVLQLDVTDQKILEESGMGAKGSTNLSNFLQRVNVMKPRKVFVHFRDDNVKAGLLKACRLLGFYGDLSILVECFLDLYRESAAHQLSCVLIINEILAGHGERKDTVEGVFSTESGREDVVRMLLEEYLSYDNMTLCETKPQTQLVPVSSSSSSSSPSVSLYLMDDCDAEAQQTATTRNKAIMLTCLFLEGVAVCAKVTGKKLRLMLTDALYPVAEKMGSEVSAVSSTAYLTLCHMAEACQYSSVDELIQSNADYLVNSISLRLRHFHRHARAPSVLSVMLQLCTTNILSLVWDSIVEILETLDEHHAEQAVVFLPVLYQLTLAVARWFPVQHTPQQAKPTSPKAKADPAEIVQLLVERHRTRLQAEAYEEEAAAEDPHTVEEEAAKMAEEGELEEKAEEKKEPPLHVKAVKEVLSRTKHLVSSSDPRLTLLALDIIQQGCLDLADHQNELLPMVHQLWQSFKQRFQDTEKLVVIKAVKTLHRLCSCCGDFIRQRVEKDVLPSLKSCLEKQAQISRQCGSSYHYTVNFKLQLTLLSTLGEMALQMGLDGAGLEQVLYCCLPYLSQHQPAKLQQACVESVKQLMMCDADIVWLALSGLYMPAVPAPPSHHFQPVTVFKGVGENNEYSTSVTMLFQHMDSSSKPDT